MNTVKILLVDDSEVVARHVAGLLGGQGFQVAVATTFFAALNHIEHHQPQALLSDLVLENGQTGLQLIEAAMALHARLAKGRLPAALLTLGTLSEDDAAKAKSLMLRVIQKPKRGHEAEFLQEVAFWLRDAQLA